MMGRERDGETEVTTEKSKFESPEVKAESPDALIGTVLDERYLLQRFIGRGAQATVFLAEQLETARPVAVKVLSSRFAHDRTKIKRFQQEARLQGQLKHEGIARVLAFGVVGDGTCYLVMEYLTGSTLKELFRRSLSGQTPLKADDVLMLFTQIAQALLYAHERDVIHRDLKPENVIVLNVADGGDGVDGVDKQVKLLDFGLSKLVAADAPAQQKLTATGVMLGTPAYMAPEQWLSAQLDARSDIYSFGCMLYEALAGHPPFEREGYAELMSAHIHDAPPPIPVPKADLPRTGLTRIAMKCLSKQPEARFRSMQHLLESLRQVADNEDLEVDLPVVRARVPNTFVLKAMLMGAAVVLVLVIVGSVIAGQWRSGSQPAVLGAQDYLRLSLEQRRRWDNVELKDNADKLSLLQEAVNTGRLAVEQAESLEDIRKTNYELAYSLGYPHLGKKSQLEAASLFVKSAKLDIDRRAKAADSEQRFKIDREQADARMRAAALYLLFLNDWPRAREQAELAIDVDRDDGVQSHSSMWAVEMLNRYSRNPAAAADAADKVLAYIDANYATPTLQLPPHMLLGYAEDAVVDYHSNGLTLVEAKKRVMKNLSRCLNADDYRGLRLTLDERLPSRPETEAKIMPAHAHTSRLFPGLVPHQ